MAPVLSGLLIGVEIFKLYPESIGRVAYFVSYFLRSKFTQNKLPHCNGLRIFNRRINIIIVYVSPSLLQLPFSSKNSFPEFV